MDGAYIISTLYLNLYAQAVGLVRFIYRLIFEIFSCS